MTMTRTAFVTGANGFIGINLCAELLNRGWEVFAMHRPLSDITYLKRFPVRLVQGDITNKDSLIKVIPEDADAVFHIAGDTSFWSRNNKRQTRVNVYGTRNVVNAALAKNAKCLIHTSSLEAWGEARGVIDESTPQLGSISSINYCRTKWAGEKEALPATELGLKVVVMNPGVVLGPFDAHTWGRVFALLRDNKFPFSAPGMQSFTHVHEVVKTHIAAVDKGQNGHNYILAGENLPLSAFGDEVGRLLGKKPPGVAPAWLLKLVAGLMSGVAYLTGKEPPMTPELARATSRKNYAFSSEKAINELGYRIIPMRKCVEDCYDWLKKEKLI